MNQLFLDNAQALRGFIVYLTGGDQSLADDVFQEVFLVVSRRAEEGFRPEGDFTAWVRGVARHTLMSVRRQRSSGFGFSQETEEMLANEAPVNDEWAHYGEVLRRCLEDLAPRARELATLRYVQDLMPTVIAERIRWTVNAVNVALSRVRRQLRECCERRLDVGGP